MTKIPSDLFRINGRPVGGVTILGLAMIPFLLGLFLGAVTN